MLIHKGMKFRISPNKTEQQKLTVQFGHARFVYNNTLAARNQYYAEHGKGMPRSEAITRIAALKLCEETNWLKEAYAQVLQQKAMDVETAFKNFFQKRSGYPKFKKKTDVQTIRYPQRVKVQGNTVYLPKVGYIRIKLHRPLEGVQKSVTVSKTKTGKYFVSFVCEVELQVPDHHGGSVGIDLGLKDFAVLSNGCRIPHPKVFRRSETRLKRVQRSLSRKRKGSSNRARARHKLALAHEKVFNTRTDFLHKHTAGLASEYAFIAVETLRVRNMLKNHRLAKSISDSGWHRFVQQLKYKSEWNGGMVFKVGSFFPSSKMCNCCKHIFKEQTLSDRIWKCSNCGAVLDRDVNAAMNILEQATAGTAGC